MDADRWAPLRARGLIALLMLILVAALKPHPTPDPLSEPLRTASDQMQSGETLAALISLEAALDFMPSLSSARARAAELALRADRPERALQHLDELSPDAAFPLDRECLRASARIEISDAAQAAVVLQDVPGRCSLNLDRLADLTGAALNQGDVRSARTLASHWARLAPMSAEAALELAVATAVLEPSAAVPIVQQGLDLAESPPPLASDLQFALEAGRSGGSPAYAFAQVGQALARAGRWQAARRALHTALEHDPDYVEARAYYGLVLDRIGADGLEALEAAYRQSDRASLPASLLGLHWLQADQPQRALPYLERAAALRPENPAYAAQLGAAHAALGDLQTARAMYERAVELAGNRPEFYRLAAEFSLRHEIDPAGFGVRTARRAYLLEPTASSADLLGYAHLLSGQLAPAERMLGRAFEQQPDSPSVGYHLALLRLEQGQVESAAALLRPLTETDAPGPYAELAERTLERIQP